MIHRDKKLVEGGIPLPVHCPSFYDYMFSKQLHELFLVPVSQRTLSEEYFRMSIAPLTCKGSYAQMAK